VRCAGRRVELSRTEWALLTHLAGNPLRGFTKRELRRDVWSYKAEGSTRTLDPHAGRLRLKLESRRSRLRVQLPRGGYRLVDRAPAVVDHGQHRGTLPDAAGSMIEVQRSRRAA
jgi:DNA-binding response OmpR family regulator